MLRKTGLVCVAAALLWGCDLFTTREFRSKPPEIRSLAGLAKAGDSVAYRVRESLWNASANTLVKELSRRRMVFSFVKDSLDGGDTLKVLAVRISDDSTGIVWEKSVRVVRFSKDGIRLASVSPGGGARFFPLKVSSQSAGASASAAASLTKADSAASDSAAFLALPALLVEGWSEVRGMGIFQVRREQTGTDTLKYQGHLEETWVIEESILDGAATVSRGTYRYGSSGLLQADQAWPGFDWRDENGSKPAEVELRRALVRL